MIMVDGLTRKRMICMKGKLSYYELCAHEQQFLLDAIREDRDLTQHLTGAPR